MVLRRNPSRASGSVATAVTAYEELNQQQNSQAVNEAAAVRALPSQQQDLAVPGPSGLPPSYAESVGAGPAASIASGRPASDNKSLSGSLSDSDSDADSANFDVESLQGDEEDWALDEAVPDPPSYEETQGQRRTSEELVQDVLATSHGPVRAERILEPLSCPVVIPQRRPGDKGRGFVRAYAPVLANHGIEQEQFLAFLKSFHKASLTSPIFIAVQVSASIASFAPGVIAMAVTSALSVAARASRDVQYRPRANHFLDRMNEQMFKPAGLYAMVVKYKQDSSPSRNSRYTPVGAEIGIGTEKINLTASHAIAKVTRTASDESSRTLNSHMEDLRIASNSKAGAIELPQAAPLIFPYLDRAMDLETGAGAMQDKVRDPGVFLQDYKDRRAQNAFATRDLDNALVLAEDQRGFKSKLADNNFGSTFAERRERRHDKYTSKLERRIDKHLEKSQEKVFKYERRLSEGRLLSRHKQMKYERHARALESLTETRRSLCGSGRGHGGLVGSLLSAAINAYNEKPTAGPSYEHGNESALRHVNSASSAPSLDYKGTNLAEQGPVTTRHQSPLDSRGPIRAPGPARRVMKEDVLYLMIVNMPSNADLAEARELLGLPQ